MDQQILCKVCGTPLVPAENPSQLNGTLPLDGSWAMDGAQSVCPKCHPELVKNTDQ